MPSDRLVVNKEFQVQIQQRDRGHPTPEKEVVECFESMVMIVNA